MSQAGQNPSRWVGRAVAVAGLASVLAAFSLAGSPAGAASGSRGAGPIIAPAPSIVVSLSEMGLGQQVSFSGLTAEQDLTIPVPDGMKPQALTGTLVLPTDIDRGWIEVISGNTRVDVVQFTAKDYTATGSALTIPLTHVPVVGRAASIRLVSHLIPLDPTCYDRSTAFPLTIATADVAYSGTDAQPATIADFLPPILRTLNIAVRGDLTDVTRQAALTLSSRIIQHYSGQATKVNLEQITGDLPADSTPLERTIVLDPTGAAGTTLTTTSGQPDLVITGAGGALDDQIDGLTSNLSQIAQSSTATFAGAQTPVTLAPSVFSFTDLNIGNLSATGAGTIAVAFGLDQAQLGGRASTLGFDLRATYTPVPSSVAGLLSFYAGDKLIASWPTSRDGQLRQHVDVPSADLSRFTNFSLNLSLTGNTGECGTALTDTLTIDPSSSITVDLSNGGVVGFQSLPQSLVPTFDVAIADADFTSLARTAAIVVGLQRETSIPLAPQLVSPSQAIAALVPALVVYPTSDAPSTLDLPLSHADTSKYVEVAPAGTTASGSVTAPVQLGCIQVALDHKRVLVVASSPDGTGVLLDKVLTWLNATPDRWFGLTGNVLAAASAGDPFTLNVGVPNPVRASTSTSTAKLIAIGVGILFVLGLLLLGLALRRHRVAARKSADADSEAEAEAGR